MTRCHDNSPKPLISRRVIRQACEVLLLVSTQSKKKSASPKTSPAATKIPRIKSRDSFARLLECAELESIALSENPLSYYGDDNVDVTPEYAAAEERVLREMVAITKAIGRQQSIRRDDDRGVQ